MRFLDPEVSGVNPKLGVFGEPESVGKLEEEECKQIHMEENPQEGFCKSSKKYRGVKAISEVVLNKKLDGGGRRRSLKRSVRAIPEDQMGDRKRTGKEGKKGRIKCSSEEKDRWRGENSETMRTELPEGIDGKRSPKDI
ncbi:hypothetical protein B0H16DRAFT_1479125 [Mycena metata]|uniref:Uncharacterized protein n=1 Tax=Mycena metata TaxID=1033252 RepID=A0AAD7H602_9AGAR|nr:hypothetical protein B0H16DRAFT_1479125 [Mycena metata]